MILEGLIPLFFLQRFSNFLKPLEFNNIQFINWNLFKLINAIIKICDEYLRIILRSNTEYLATSKLLSSHHSSKLNEGKAFSLNVIKSLILYCVYAAVAIIPALSPQRRSGGIITFVSVISLSRRSRRP